jgi:hypothetical protein
MRIGGNARKLSAVTEGFMPVPISGRHRKRMARLGTILATEKTPVDTRLMALLYAQRTPISMPNTDAISRERPLNKKCSPIAEVNLCILFEK